MVEMRVSGITLDEEKTPLAVLSGVDGGYSLTLSIGPIEAMTLSIALSGASPTLPGAHVLLLETLKSLGHTLRTIELAGIHNGTLCAYLVIDDKEHTAKIECRPADALTLSVYAALPVWTDEDVFHGVTSVHVPVGAAADQNDAGGRILLSDASEASSAGAKNADLWTDLLRRLPPASSRKM